MTLLRERTGKLYRALIPTAPNALLFTNTQLTFEQAQALQRMSPEACATYLDGTSGASATAARLPHTLITHGQTSLPDLIQVADPDHAPVVTRMQGPPALQLAMATLPPAQQRILTVPALRHSTSPAERCQTLISSSRSILVLPEVGRALALCGMYAGTPTPGSWRGPSG